MDVICLFHVCIYTPKCALGQICQSIISNQFKYGTSRAEWVNEESIEHNYLVNKRNQKHFAKWVKSQPNYCGKYLNLFRN